MASQIKHDAEGLTVREYLGVLWRRKWVVVLLAVIGAVSAYGFSALQPEQYRADVDLIYEKQLDSSNPLTGQTYTDPTERTLELNSVARMLDSPDMTQRARQVLQTQGVNDSDITVTAEPFTETGSNASTTATNVVRITARSGDATVSAAAANAYADAFIDWRSERVQAQIDSALEALRAQLSTFKGAAKNTTDYLVLQQRVQDLEILKSTATGNFRVLSPAVVPDSPESPRPLRNALLGLGVGLLLGIALAFLLEALDTGVRTDAEISRTLRQPILARVPRISRRLLDESALVTLTEPDGPPAEAFRRLRTNLSFVNVDGQMRSVLVTSCLQGEGKSVTVANLAVTLALGGKRVIVVDADLRRPRMHSYFGLANRHGVSTVVTSQSELLESLQPVKLSASASGNGSGPLEWTQASGSMSRLYVLTSGPQTPNPGEIVSSAPLGSVIASLTDNADIVLVDSPAMLPVGDTAALADKVDGLLFLVEPDVVGRRQLAQAQEQLDKLPCRLLGVIVARRKTDADKYAGHYYHRDTPDAGARAPRARVESLAKRERTGAQT